MYYSVSQNIGYGQLHSNMITITTMTPQYDLDNNQVDTNLHIVL